MRRRLRFGPRERQPERTRRADGLITTRQGLGAFVANDVQRWPFRIDSSELKTVSDVLQVIELRMSLEIADHAYVLDDGHVVYSGPARELAADEARVQSLAGASAEEWTPPS